MKIYYLFVLCIMFLASSVTNAVINQDVGVVEGFYWTEANEVNGEWDMYTFSDRQRLITMMAANNLGVYMFQPQTVDTNALWDSQQLSEWTTISSLGNSLGVKIVYGLRPGWLDGTTTTKATFLTRLNQIASAGITYYSINFDDATGVSSTTQQQREVSLINYLIANAPTMTLYSMIPYAYYQNMFSTRTLWQNALSTINTVPTSIPFIFTGTKIVPSTMQVSQFPTLSPTRQFKFFDNWIAGDTSDRISWGMIDNRVQSVIFTSAYGYILNLAFPLERCVQHIYCLGQLATGSTSCSVTDATNYWANYLNTYGFIHNGKTVTQVASSLAAATIADTYFDTISDMEAAYPNLATIFSTPPQ